MHALNSRGYTQQYERLGVLDRADVDQAAFAPVDRRLTSQVNNWCRGGGVRARAAVLAAAL
jgi:hypothetical protein